MPGKGSKPRDAIPIRKFVAVLLRHTCFHGRLYSESSIVAGLNSVIGTSEHWDPIDTRLLRSAFKQKLVGSGEHYTLKCSELLGCRSGYTPACNNLYVIFHGVHGRQEVAIGRFKSEEAFNKAAGKIHEWCVMPADERDELIQHLTDRKQETSRNRKGDVKKPVSKSKKRRHSRHNVTPTLDTPSSKSLDTPISPLRKKRAHAVNTDAERFEEAFKESEKVQQPRQPNVYYHLFGRAGKIHVGEGGSVTVEDLIKKLEPVAEHEDDKN